MHMCLTIKFLLVLSLLDLFFVHVSVCLIKGILSHNCIRDSVLLTLTHKKLSRGTLQEN